MEKYYQYYIRFYFHKNTKYKKITDNYMIHNHIHPTTHHTIHKLIRDFSVQKTTLYIQQDGFAQKDGNTGKLGLVNPEREANDDADQKNDGRKRSRSRTYSIDVVNHPELVPEVEKKPFGLRQSYLMIPASFCDMCGTCLMYVSLTLTSAASFQMMRG